MEAQEVIPLISFICKMCGFEGKCLRQLREHLTSKICLGEDLSPSAARIGVKIHGQYQGKSGDYLQLQEKCGDRCKKVIEVNNGHDTVDLEILVTGESYTADRVQDDTVTDADFSHGLQAFVQKVKSGEAKDCLQDLVFKVNNCLEGQGRIVLVSLKAGLKSGQQLSVSASVDTPKLKKPDVIHDSSGCGFTAVFKPNDSQEYSVATHGPIVDCRTTQGLGMGSDDSSHSCVSSHTPKAEGSVQMEYYYKCYKCRVRGFKTEVELDIHMSCHMPTPLHQGHFQCPDPSCAKVVSTYPRMLSHMAAHPQLAIRLQGTESFSQQVGLHICAVCGAEFSKRTNLVQHKRKVHHKPDRQCDICGTTFTNMSQKAFELHVEKCQQILYKCQECDYRSNVFRLINEHCRLHQGNGLQCDMCSKVFTNQRLLNAHVKRHESNRPRFSCAQCGGSEFQTKDALHKHLRRFHEDQAEVYTCGQCPYSTKMLADFKKHTTSVHLKRFHCSECSFKTNNKATIEDHASVHNPENSVACDYSGCFYRCTSREELGQHLAQVHKVSGRHRCPVCQKHFLRKTHLLRHLVTHTNSRPYRCDDCGQNFRSHGSYYAHRRRTGHDLGKTELSSVPQYLDLSVTRTKADGSDLNDELLVHQAHHKQLMQPLLLQPNSGQDCYSPSQMQGAENISYIFVSELEAIDTAGQQQL